VRMRLPRRKVQELLLELFGLKLSSALIDRTLSQTARSIEPLEAQLAQELAQAALVHVDETSWPEAGAALWLWVLCCSHTVLYVIGSRAKEMLSNALSTAFAGTLMTDGYGVYRDRGRRLRCWAHLRRKLCGVAESTDRRAAQAGAMLLGVFDGLMQAVYMAREQLLAWQTQCAADPSLPRPEPPSLTHVHAIDTMLRLCEEQRDAPHQALRAVAREFLYDWHAIMRVLAQPQMPLTNNAAERQLRHWVIARRISYGTRTLAGSNSFAMLASVIDTCRLRGASITATLAGAIYAARQGLDAPDMPPIPEPLLMQQRTLAGR
jgi:transposase